MLIQRQSTLHPPRTVVSNSCKNECVSDAACAYQLMHANFIITKNKYFFVNGSHFCSEAVQLSVT
jgi:muramidase (phage lysozyme)